MRVLVVNAGSSSLKFALYGTQPGATEIAAEFHLHDGRAWLEVKQGVLDAGPAWETTRETFHADCVARLLAGLARAGAGFDAVGHRVVHGGAALHAPTWLDRGMIADLASLTPLAPLHQPPALHAVEALLAQAPECPQLAAFDTAFHAHLPEINRHYALPARVRDAGVVRYGFHGIAYASIAAQLTRIAPGIAAGRVVAAHLGSGASVCAMRDGVSQHTSLGFSTLDGLPMSTRCGALDPGVLLHLLQTEGWSLADCERLLYRESGLIGLSGLSCDMRTLLESDSEAAAFAVEFFVARVAETIAAMATALGGMDALVFSGGIGERAAEVRARVAARLAWLGVRVDVAANAALDAQHAAAAPCCFSTPDSSVALMVVHADEQAMIEDYVRGTPLPA